MEFLSCRFIVWMIFGAHLLAFLQLGECQRCGKANQENPKCPNNLCCSTAEYCGDTGEHCLTLCNPKYGRCNPFKVNASIGFPSIGNRCGLENNNRYCPNDWCCSEFGYCDRTDVHCGDGCQHYFGQCHVIADCSLPSQNYNIFPEIPKNQRSLSNKEKKNFWYLFCKPGSILKKITEPHPVTCNSDDGSWPEDILPECEENVVYKPIEIDSYSNKIFDGNLLTCLRYSTRNTIGIPIDNTYFAIRDIRISTHKTSSNRFTLSIVDVNKMANNETILYKKTFNDIIKYGQTVVFFSNLTLPLASRWKRYIRLELLSDMTICEIEVSSFGQEEGNIKWIAIVTSSIIFFILAILILTVLCIRSHSEIGQHSAIDGRDRPLSTKNDYSNRERAPRPPGSDAVFPGHSSSHCHEDDLYEEIIYNLNTPLHNNSANDLLGDPQYDEAVSLSTSFNRPRMAPPSVPQNLTH